MADRRAPARRASLRKDGVETYRQGLSQGGRMEGRRLGRLRIEVPNPGLNPAVFATAVPVPIQINVGDPAADGAARRRCWRNGTGG